ncbi:Anthranilate/para-aminobenzoate synthases component II [Candidatus Carsonella ruddii CS isolate Thao2000]|uniref:Anthranilate/para-aminobenzoate synthases component II n=1 Tax=Candidatus Carsonella ruddii CS isolate Thao2000 TaxID=1202537 RepID=J7GYN4_CARRU|nr:Anthranilate/para-aminobenzoate synthase component II [Candidatus Carsonella ruddii]AFP83708.1 Anthranilate/para-aminobenzoate synthases component II [Candidatus Carsonella ruddii CS isolate Thao2000]
MILFIDNYDSFSYNIIRKLSFNFYLNSINIFLKKINLFYEKILILGPGAYNPFCKNIITLLIDKYIGKKKIIGICLGHQIICNYFGSKILKLNKISHGFIKKNLIFYKKYKIFIIKKFIRYNSLLSNKNNYLKIFSKYNFKIFIIKNFRLKIKSFQHHPESLISDFNIII